jgi:hypothetical protein
MLLAGPFFLPDPNKISEPSSRSCRLRWFGWRQLL